MSEDDFDNDFNMEKQLSIGMTSVPKTPSIPKILSQTPIISSQTKTCVPEKFVPVLEKEPEVNIVKDVHFQDEDEVRHFEKDDVEIETNEQNNLFSDEDEDFVSQATEQKKPTPSDDDYILMSGVDEPQSENEGDEYEAMNDAANKCNFFVKNFNFSIFQCLFV